MTVVAVFDFEMGRYFAGTSQSSAVVAVAAAADFGLQRCRQMHCLRSAEE